MGRRKTQKRNRNRMKINNETRIICSVGVLMQHKKKITKKHYQSHQTHLQIAYLIWATCWNQNCFTFILLKCPSFNAFTHVQMKFRNTSKDPNPHHIESVQKWSFFFFFQVRASKVPIIFFLSKWVKQQVKLLESFVSILQDQG